MTIQADMIIFHEPNGLEFAGNGKHLGLVRRPHFRDVFASITNSPKHQRPHLIAAVYSKYFPHAVVEQKQALLP